MHQSFWKLCLIANLVVCCVATAHSQAVPTADLRTGPQSNAGHVTLANGDRMPASINLFSDGQIEFGSSLFNETVKLPPEHVHSFGFRPGVGVGDAQQDSPFLFRLKSGARLYGKLVSLDETECVFESKTFGKVAVPITNLIEISRNVGQLNTTVYSSLNWQNLGNSNRPNAQGRLWVAANAKTPLVVPQVLDGSGVFQIEFLSNKKTEFQIKLSGKDKKTAISIGVADGTLVVEAGDELEFSDFELFGGAKRLTVDWDGETLHVLNELGRSLVKTKLKNSTPLSVSIKNEGGNLQINELSVSSRNRQVSAAAVPAGQRLVKRLDGDWVAAKTITADSAMVTFEGQQQGVEKIEEIEMAQVDSIWFGGKLDANLGAKPSERESADQPNSNPAARYTCLWSQGQRVEFDRLKWQGEKLKYETGEFESQGFVSNDLPAEVFLSKALVSQRKASPASIAAPANASGDQEFLLAISGIPFSGSYSQGDVSNPIRWQFFGFIDPVTLNIQRKIEIRRTGSASSRRVKESPDRLLLNDGSIVPCRVGVADQKSLSFESSLVPAAAVPVNEVRCCFFNSNNVQWKATLTNETVQRALTLPRFSDDLGFTHVLIGKNGDLLRGDLIRIGVKEIEFESRFEPLLIPRENVVGIVAVGASAIDQAAKKTAAAAEASESAGKASDSADVASAPTDERKNAKGQVIVHVDCGNDFVAVGRYVSLDDEKAVLDSQLLGKFKLDGDSIRQIAFNSEFRDVSTLQYFTDWQVNASIKPRWATEAEFAADSNELLNQPAPDFALPMLSDSQVFQLSNHLGKLVVINFWESTSKPSVLGIPEYRQVIQKFSPQEVVFVAANQGETVSTVSKFLAGEKWSSLDIVMDPNKEVAGKFKVTGIPHLTVLDRNGVVRFIKVGYSAASAAELEKQLRELLSE